MELEPLEDVHQNCFYLAVDNLITDKMLKIFSLVAEYASFMKHS